MQEVERPRRWQLGIASAVTLTFGTLLAVAVLGAGGVAWRANEVNTIELLGQTSERYLDTLAGLTREHLDDGMFVADHIAALVRQGALDVTDTATLKSVMSGALAGGDQVRGVAVVRADGIAMRVGTLDGEVGSFFGDWSQRPEIQDLLRGARRDEMGDGFFIVWADDLNAPHVSASAPLWGPDGTFVGAVAAVIGISDISAFVDSLTGNVRSVVLLGRDHVLAHPDMAGVLPGLSAETPLPRREAFADEVLARLWEESAMDPTLAAILSGRNVRAQVVEVDGEEFVHLYREIGTIDGETLSVGVYASLSENSQALTRLFNSGLVALAILLLSIGLSILLGRALARPVRRLEAAAEAVGRLEVDAMPPFRESHLRELDAAQRAFASMRGAMEWFAIYVPRTLVFSLMRLGPEAARSVEREVSVLFTDIAGFTQLAETRSPEETAALLNAHFTLLAACVEAEGGTVDKYIGDSLMAFWGAPDAQPDHAARACRAARAMAEAVGADNRARAARGEPPIRLRVGVHSGPAVVGNIGAPGRMNYTLIGDTVNVAQRIEGLGKTEDPAAETLVLASADTVAACAGAVEATTLGALPVRGRGQPVEVCRLV